MLTIEEKLKLFEFLNAAFYRALHIANDTELVHFFDHAKQITEACKVIVHQL